MSDATFSKDPLLSNGRRRSEVLKASEITRPNGGKRVIDPYKKQRKNRYRWEQPLPAPPKKIAWLIEAAKEHDPIRMEALLTLPNINLEVTDNHGLTAVGIIAETIGHLEQKHTLYDEQTRLWVQDKTMTCLMLLLKAGADPNGAKKSITHQTPLMLIGNDKKAREALMAAGASPSFQCVVKAMKSNHVELARFWMKHWLKTLPTQKSHLENPFNELTEFLFEEKNPRPIQRFLELQNAALTLSMPSKAMRAQAWIFARQLVRAGFSLEAPLACVPTESADNNDMKIHNEEDTLLIRACRLGEHKIVKRLLKMGANPQTLAPNGRHPFMAWVCGHWSTVRKTLFSDSNPKEIKKELQILDESLQFFSNDLLTRVPSFGPRGFPTYCETHPLAALLYGPCLSKHSEVRQKAWQLIDSMKFECPLPTEKKASIIEVSIGLWPTYNSITNEGAEENINLFSLFLQRMQGWKEAIATPSEDQYRLAQQTIMRMTGEHYRRNIDIFLKEWQAIENTGIDLSDQIIRDILDENKPQRTLPYLCDAKEKRRTQEGSLPLNALTYCLALKGVTKSDKEKACHNLMKTTSKERKGIVEAFMLLHNNGFSLDKPLSLTSDPREVPLLQNEKSVVEIMGQLTHICPQVIKSLLENGIRVTQQDIQTWTNDHRDEWTIHQAGQQKSLLERQIDVSHMKPTRKRL